MDAPLARRSRGRVGADTPLRTGAPIRLAPGGSAIPWRAIARISQERDARTALEGTIRSRFPDRRVTFHASGREAMRIALVRLADRSGRREIAIPAYGCFSIPASVVAAGLRVRLVDVDERGQLSREAVARIPFEHVAAIVVGNLFGVPEAIADVVRAAHARDTAVVDDAAQSLGARSPDGSVGDRGDVGILSFGRGKPLSALGGGAAIWRDGSLADRIESGLAEPNRIAALLRGLGYNGARQPAVLGLLASIPALGIGMTTYDPAFERGAMSGSAVALAAALAPELDELNQSRRERAHALSELIRSKTAFVPLLESEQARGVFTRLAILAPTAARRDRVLATLAHLGATAMYPSPIDSIRALLPHRTDETPCPGARDFCDRLLTLPTHPGLFPARLEEVVRVLARS